MYSEVPTRWKHSYVTPIPKKEPYTNANNYRPVSITSVFCRIFEKSLKDVLLHHLRINHMIPQSQHGFVKGRSVETNLLECINDWTKILDNKKCCDIIYFDFAKAFDRVSIPKLLYRLDNLGMHPNIRNWLSSFLSDRTFQVRIDNSFSVIKHF